MVLVCGYLSPLLFSCAKFFALQPICSSYFFWLLYRSYRPSVTQNFTVGLSLNVWAHMWHMKRQTGKHQFNASCSSADLKINEIPTSYGIIVPTVPLSMPFLRMHVIIYAWYMFESTSRITSTSLISRRGGRGKGGGGGGMTNMFDNTCDILPCIDKILCAKYAILTNVMDLQFH